jgi:2-polyprenyl-3-methyl-5-hydroxy-6-metoxy-1,4-benzoquinol methylase
MEDGSFENHMLDIMNKSSLALMLSIGHRTKLLDALSSLPPSTSHDISSKARLNERYVREWLGAMVTASIIDYEPSSKLYSLSKEKADFLTRNGLFNFAASMQFIPLLAKVEDQILGCFENGGGVPYESFTRFHEVMAEESNQTVIAKLIDSILPSVPRLIDKLNRGIEVLDVGCGSGRAINLMAKTFPKSRFSGYDFSDEAIRNAASEARELGLSNAVFRKQDAASFDHSQQFDFITAFDAIHDQANPDLVLKNIKNALKPDGVFLMQDIGASSDLEKNIDHPLAPFLYTVSCLHCMTVSLALNGMGLGAMWGKEKATRMLKDAGFSDVDVKQLPHDPINYYYIAR